jgi:hypothetical protein
VPAVPGTLETMSETKLVRPPQVTAAGWLLVAGSVVVVLMAFSEVAVLRSMDTRETVAERVSGSSWEGLGLQGGLTALRITLMVSAACAATTAVLGWQVLQRSRGARVAASVVAVPLFVSGLVVGELLGGLQLTAVVVAPVVMLWLQPARDWFDGVASAPPAPARDPYRDPFGDRSRLPARDPLLDLPPPTAPPLHPTPYAAAAARSATARPAAVTWACSITWACTVLVVVVMGVALVQVLVTPEVYLDEVRRQNPELTMTDADLRTLLSVSFAVFVVWSAAAAGLALLVWRGVPWAAVALGVSAGLACLTLLPVVACVATGVLLLRPESRAWLTRSGQPSPAG